LRGKKESPVVFERGGKEGNKERPYLSQQKKREKTPEKKEKKKKEGEIIRPLEERKREERKEKVSCFCEHVDVSEAETQEKKRERGGHKFPRKVKRGTHQLF